MKFSRLIYLLGLVAVLMTAPTAPSLSAQTSFPVASGEKISNTEVRTWYNKQVATIADRNAEWEKAGFPVDERAFLAWGIRHNARVEAREMMEKKREVKKLQRRDKRKYGNPDGPTFGYLVEKYQEEGLTGNAIYEAIIESSQRTNKKVNEQHGQ